MLEKEKNLAEKYGRRNSDTPQQQTKNADSTKNTNTTNTNVKSNVFRDTLQRERQQSQNMQQQYSANSTVFTKKSKVDKNQAAKEKEIKANIENLINQYTQEHKDLSAPISNTVTVNKQETIFVKFLKAVIIFLIIAVVACIVIAFIKKPEINIEGEQLIEQIKKTEDLYYAKVQKYHYFSKTNYDHTLGIDLSKYKYFTSYEVVPDEESGNYAAKAYGATNAFTITYYAIKSWLKSR